MKNIPHREWRTGSGGSAARGVWPPARAGPAQKVRIQTPQRDIKRLWDCLGERRRISNLKRTTAEDLCSLRELADKVSAADA
ncbi:hypothetical protein EVAR_42543_1 [Eumeta japonica]|uniref:Uncharacterized protein n=1 Tax=Eumeta variegata TaxID=151549 RepID=A0A4C1WUN6_EUMVA|nr:hypothetical protein EVAR_42543_1 [Eumeta japonica]